MMFLKAGIKIFLISAEIFFAIYSLAVSDNLLVKFIFFALTAMIIAFLVTKIINKLLPVDKDYISSEQEDENVKDE